MLMNRVALFPLSIVAMFPHGPFMSRFVQVAASLPSASITNRQPAPRERVLPSLLGVLPTITQPLFRMVIAVLKPTPPGHSGRRLGNSAKVESFLVAGL